MIVDELKKAILQYAIQGKLTKQINSDSKVELSNQAKTCEKPFNIPHNWKWLLLKDIGKFVRGSGIKRTDMKNEGISCIRYGELYTTYNYFINDVVSFTSEEVAKTSKHIKNGDILLTLTGENKEEIGKSIAFLCDYDTVIGGDLATFTEHNQNTKYLTYFLNSPFAIKQKADGSNGNIIVHISATTLGNILIPLPPLEEQQRIVDKIEELFNLLDELKNTEVELHVLKSKFPDEMRKSILNSFYDIKNIEYKKMQDIVEVYTGTSISVDVKKTKFTNIEIGLNYIATKDVEFNNTVNYNNGVKIPFDEPKFRYADVNDVLLCIEGGSAGRKIAILSEKVCFGNKLCCFHSDKINNRFLYYYLQSPLFQRIFRDNLNGIIGGVSINKIKEIQIPFPPIEEQRRIVEKLDSILPIIESL